MNHALHRGLGAVLALLAVVAMGLLLLPGGLLHAQDSAIKYAENGTDPVATFTAIDPEEEDITWGLGGTDAADFKIDNGVLTFASTPNYEAPADDDTNNTYSFTVTATAGTSTTPAVQTVSREVTVEVTNVDEPGSIMLSTLQPQVGVQVTATLQDVDVRAADGSTVALTPTWQWYRGATEIPGATAANFTPSSGDVGFKLVVKASYNDAEGDDKNAEQTSAHPVRVAPASNIAPVFPDEDIVDTNVLIKPRDVDENTASGENIGAPIAATDPGDILTYAFAGAGNAAAEGNFAIDRATGQIMTKRPLDHETAATYTVTVTATDPFGVEVTADVTINVGDVNEAPTITGSPAAAISFAENGDIAAALATYVATDVDQGADDSSPDTLTWSLTGADAGEFDISTAGALTFDGTRNYESPGDANGDNDYEITVVVSDGKGNSDEHDVTISVMNVEEDGTVTISTLQPRVGVELSASLTDPDGGINSLMWQWYRADSLALASLPTAECDATTTDDCLIANATSSAYTPVAGDIDNRLNAVATYKDGMGTANDMAFAVAAADVIADRRPKAPEFPDQDLETDGDQLDQERSIDEGPAPAADATDADKAIGAPVAATDPNPGDVPTYTLGGTDAASFDIVASSGQLQRKAALDHETKDSYSVTVTATDSLQQATTINVTIEVNDVDEPPELDGDATASFAENGTGTVATYTATDPEGKDIVWTLATGGDADDFSIDGGVLKFNNPPNFEDDQGTGSGDNEYVVTVEASAGADGDAAIRTATQEVTVTVTDEDEPGSVMLSTLQPQVGQQVTATLTDGDTITDSTITWQWLRGSTPIDASSSTGGRTATYTPIDGDAGNRLRARATYDDSEGEDKIAQQDSARSTRRAPGTNTAPVFPDQDPATAGEQTAQEREVAENTPAGRSIGAPVTAIDSGDVLTYSLAGTDGTSFDIDRATGQLRTKAALDHETDDSYTVEVTATDPFGVAATAVVTIEVTDVNEAPTITGSPAAVISFAEIGETTPLPTYTATDVDDGEQATLQWSLKGADEDDFDISSTGVLTFDPAPNFESPADADADNDYHVTIVVTDAKGNTDEHDVTVTVTNVEEAGRVTFSTLQPRVGVGITATLTDADLGITGLTWQWSKAGTDIADATSATYTPVAADIGATLTATPTYRDGAVTDTTPADGVDDGDTVSAENTTANTVIADIRNKAPKFPDQDMETDGDQTDQERDVPENYASGDSYGTPAVSHPNIGAPVVATDKQFATTASTTSDDDTLTYTLGGPDAASFNIVRTSGQITAKAALDHEEKSTYVVTVTATDPSGLSATVNVTINVTDVDEAPEIMLGGLAISGPSSVDYAEDRRDAVATYTASGPNAASAAWTLGGADAGAFSIPGGVLTFAVSPNFESPADADGDNAYEVTILADDGTYESMRAVTVQVTDVDEPDPVSAYDANNDGEIDKDEVIAAINDYLDAGVPTRDEVIQLINLYLGD